MVRKLIAVSAVLTLLTACSTVTGIFKSDKEKATAPAELTDIADVCIEAAGSPAAASR